MEEAPPAGGEDRGLPEQGAFRPKLENESVLQNTSGKVFEAEGATCAKALGWTGCI